MSPDKISILTNSNSNHQDEILNLINEADEIVFAVGFLKDSGFRLLKKAILNFTNNTNRTIKFFIGTGFGETSPKALTNLNSLIKHNRKHLLVVCTTNVGIFHPKIYFFRKSNSVTIITGSANLTESGMKINDEVSIKTETTVDSDLYKQFIKYFDELSKKYYVQNVQDLIEKYKNALQEYEFNNFSRPKFFFKTNEIKINSIGVDLIKLKEYYDYYKDSLDFISPLLREEKYMLARENLNEIIKKVNPTKDEFQNLFGPLVGHVGYKKLWNSGGIHRKTYRTLDHFSTFQELVKMVKDNSEKDLDVAFDICFSFLKQKKQEKKIHGVGLNILAEIFVSFNPSKFAILNENPISALKLLGKEFKPINNFKGADYAEYVSLLSQIKYELNMSTFLEIDSFFNYVYWHLYKE